MTERATKITFRLGFKRNGFAFIEDKVFLTRSAAEAYAPIMRDEYRMYQPTYSFFVREIVETTIDIDIDV